MAAIMNIAKIHPIVKSFIILFRLRKVFITTLFSLLIFCVHYTFLTLTL
jgi:hypothetical protein